MSRSRKKYCSHGCCCGSNTEFYRDRNRSTRTKNRQMLRTMLANMTIDEITDVIYNITNRLNCKDYNSWNEPTDGKVVAKTFKDYLSPSYANYLKSTDPDTYNDTKAFFEKHKRK